VEAYGTVDEMNAAIGVARTFLGDAEIDEVLARIQESLFVVGSDLAAPLSEDEAGAGVPRISSAQVGDLEALIDRYQAQLPWLHHFVVPGGERAAALLHLARTVCRRAERRVAALADEEPVNSQVVVYLNRLGDLLFVLARLVNHRAGVAEHTWRASHSPDPARSP
jgi:cob(I)alamin adenosyltransferase